MRERERERERRGQQRDEGGRGRGREGAYRVEIIIGPAIRGIEHIVVSLQVARQVDRDREEKGVRGLERPEDVLDALLVQVSNLANHSQINFCLLLSVHGHLGILCDRLVGGARVVNGVLARLGAELVGETDAVGSVAGDQTHSLDAQVLGERRNSLPLGQIARHGAKEIRVEGLVRQVRRGRRVAHHRNLVKLEEILSAHGRARASRPHRRDDRSSRGALHARRSLLCRSLKRDAAGAARVVHHVLDLRVRQKVVKPPVRLVVDHVERESEVTRALPDVRERDGVEPSDVNLSGCLTLGHRQTQSQEKDAGCGDTQPAKAKVVPFRGPRHHRATVSSLLRGEAGNPGLARRDLEDGCSRRKNLIASSPCPSRIVTIWYDTSAAVKKKRKKLPKS